ncbi:MAG: hypothetical protein SGJ17_12780 [Hyphomicrobiales bacterium]|nr:hypothetical protein [Hyphomicrobiales bacterium]
MQKCLFLALCLISASSAFAQSGNDVIKGETLRKMLSGTTIFINTPFGELPVRYSGNGTMTSSSPSQLAAMAGEPTNSDTGQWWISGNRLCQRWQVWVQKKSYCFEMRGDENSVTWRRNDGKSGTARIGS